MKKKFLLIASSLVIIYFFIFVVSASTYTASIIGLDDSYPNNLSIGTTTGLNFWNLTGLFNQNNYITSDFSSQLNSIVDSGNCNSNGAFINGLFCNIPFVFHSDSDGLLNYSSLYIDYELTGVSSYPVSPTDNEVLNYSDISFNCSGSSNLQLSNATAYVWNKNGTLFSTNTENLSGLENSTIINISLPSGLYYWNCLMIDVGGSSSFAYENNSLIVDGTAPTIDFINPLLIGVELFLTDASSVILEITDDLTYLNKIYFYIDGIIQSIKHSIVNQFIPDGNFSEGDFSLEEPYTNAFDGNFSTTERYLYEPTGGIRSILLNYTIPEYTTSANITFKWGSYVGWTPTQACFGDIKIDYQNYTNENEWTNLYICENQVWDFGDPRSYNCLTTHPVCTASESISVPYDALLESQLVLNISLDYVGSGGNPLGSYLYEVQINWTNGTVELDESLSDDTYVFSIDAYDGLGHVNQTENYTLVVDTTAPGVTLVSPADNFNSPNSINNLVLNYTDSYQLKNTTYRIYSNDSLLNTTSLNISGTTNETNLSYSFTEDGEYSWNVNVCDSLGHCNQTENYTIYINTDIPAVNIYTPADEYSTTSKTHFFVYSVSDNEYEIDTCKLYFGTEDSFIEVESTDEVTELIPNLFTHTSSAGTYLWNVWCNTTNGTEGFSPNNFTLILTDQESGGGGAPGEIEKVPTIAVKRIIETDRYSELDRAIIFSRMNNLCSFKETSEKTTFTVQDFSGSCSLKKADMETLRSELAIEGVSISIENLISFYYNFNEKQLEQVYFSLDIVRENNLFTSVLGITNPMRVNPPRLDRPFIITDVNGNITIEQIFVVNKDIKECLIISGDKFTCELISSNSVKMTLYINDTDFFDEIFQGEMSITSEADPESLEIKRIVLLPRVYNLTYSVAGIPTLWIIIMLIVVLLIISVFFILRTKLQKELKRRFK